MKKWIILNGNYDNFAISNEGDLKNIKTNKVIKQHISKTGYARVAICQNNKKATFSVHRLVAMHFIENKNNKPYVNHIDGNKLNNKSSNLEWCTAQENTIHAQNNELKNDMCPVKLIDINDNEEYFFESISQASKFIGVNKSNLSRALKRPSNVYHNFKIEKL